MELNTLLEHRPPSDHRGAVRPLAGANGWVLVAGRTVCAVCGRPAEPVSADRWHHAPPDAPPIRESPWLVPVTPAALATISSYEEFGRSFPWAVRPDLGGPTVTSASEWQEGTRRLTDYAEHLDAVTGRSTIGDGNPLLDLYEILLGPATGTAPAPDHPAAPLYPGLPPGLIQMLDVPQRRRELAALLAWAVPTDEALAVLRRHAPLVESGAGMGYWASLLESGGTDVVAYDLDPPSAGDHNHFHPTDHPPWTTVHRASSITAVSRHPDRTLLLCWPPDDNDEAGYGAVRAYRGDVVVYVGDPEGGTGSVRLHRELARNWSAVEEVALPWWSHIRDRLVVYRRNRDRRPLVERDRCYECRRFLPTGAIGRCDACVSVRPPALALQAGRHRVEYPLEAVMAMPAGLRYALLDSPNRIV